MYRVDLPTIGTAAAWRDAARRALAAQVPPDDIAWGMAGAAPGLFDTGTPLPAPRPGNPPTVSRRFVELADSVVWHADPQRFGRLYALLWRLRSSPALVSDQGDAQVAELRRMAKAVHRCQHKMKAFVRFREIPGTGPRRRFAAWFEPTHHTVEPTADFFVRRFADMDWRILTPDVCAVFEGGRLRLEPGVPKPDLADDAAEALWVTYFRNIYNPARLKPAAMRSEMPVKYWKNLPEAAAIPDLIAGTEARLRAMAEAGPTLPHPRAAKVVAGGLPSAWDVPGGDLPAAIRACTRCPLHCAATQAVPGQGPDGAPVMIVGEQPGDAEDLAGQPFVGPAGQELNRAMAAAGLDRGSVFLTNAVKHFKHVARGRRRLHATPDRTEIEHCLPWLRAEIDRHAPRLIVALGATAAHALTGRGADVTTRRGGIEPGTSGVPVLITAHPSYILRLPAGPAADAARRDLVADLSRARAVAAG